MPQNESNPVDTHVEEALEAFTKAVSGLAVVVAEACKQIALVLEALAQEMMKIDESDTEETQ